MSKLIAELYKSRNILLDQLEIQEYDVSDFTGCSIQEINIMQDRNQMDMLIHRTSKEKKDDNDDKQPLCLVPMYDEPNPGTGSNVIRHPLFDFYPINISP